MEITEREFLDLKERISTLERLVALDPSSTDIDSLEDRVASLEEVLSDSTKDSRPFTPVFPPYEEPKRPFDVIAESEDGEIKFYVFAPDGCVVVDGENAEIEGADDEGYVELDMDAEEEDEQGSVYCHVSQKSDKSWKVKFDCEESSTAKYSFKIREYGEREGDGKSFTMAASVVFISDATEASVSGSVSYIADVKYDMYTHQLQQRTDTHDLKTGAVTEGDYDLITEAVALSSEV